MGWLKEWALRTFFANRDPQMWEKMLVLLVGPQAAAVILNVVQGVDTGRIPVAAAKARVGAAAVPTGPEKNAVARAEVIAQLEALGLKLATVLIGIAIEIAVAYLRSKTGGLV